jgi:TonB family protein
MLVIWSVNKIWPVKRFVLAVFVFALISVASQASFAATCESLASLKLPNTTITSAQQVAAGAFVPPGASAPSASAKKLPAFCRVLATLQPAKDSDIKVEVWLPLTGWNGKYRGQGNGGFAGTLTYYGMGVAISQGYATASTDTGHADANAADASWALGHPDKIVDFGWRAIHEMTVQSKAITQAFYGKPIKHSYFAACSNGGRQGLMEAQRFPEDYDGIIAGAPANYWTQVFAAFLWNMQAMQAEPGSYITAKKVPAIAAAVVAACDEKDDVKDGVLNDPRECRFDPKVFDPKVFDPKVLLCKESDSDNCLTAPQVAALKKIYDGPVDSKGKQMFPGFLPGGEQGGGGWATWIAQTPGKDLQTAFASGFFNNMISSSEPLDLKTINVEAAIKLAHDQQAQTFDAVDPDLKRFMARGGKLIVYHGWSDAALPPLGSIQYFDSVTAALGSAKTDSFMRLFMAPGVQHCGGGPGADSFGEFAPAGDAQHDLYLALEQWVEKGAAPEKIIATKYVDEEDSTKGVKMTRPLCPYPESAVYKGEGDTNDAANFECVAGPLKNNDLTMKLPRAVHTPEPKYSKSARARKIQGVVTVSLVIGADGRVFDVKVLKSLEPSLDANAVTAVKTWKFAPATRNGQPIAARMNIEMEFRVH